MTWETGDWAHLYTEDVNAAAAGQDLLKVLYTQSGRGRGWISAVHCDDPGGGRAEDN